MYGPSPQGHWSKGAHRAWGILRPGRRYRVIRRFVDHDGDAHEVGEEWTFAGHNFSPHDDGLSLFVSIDGDEWHIRLQLIDGQQKFFEDDPGAFVEECGAPP